jgi:hypothetical protein
MSREGLGKSPIGLSSRLLSSLKDASPAGPHEGTNDYQHNTKDDLPLEELDDSYNDEYRCDDPQKTRVHGISFA